MSAVTIPQIPRKPIQIKQWVRNARAPAAQFQSLLAELAGYGAAVRSKPIWRSPGLLHAAGASLVPTSQAADRERYHFSFHAGPFAQYAWGHVELARQNDGAATDCYVRLELRKWTDGTAPSTTPVLAYAEYRYGSGTSASDVPDDISGGVIILQDAAESDFVPYELEPEIDYYVSVVDKNYGRFVCGELHEIALAPDTENGYASTNFGDGSPIYDEDRRLIVSMARRTWKRHALCLARGHADQTARTLSSGTLSGVLAQTIAAPAISAAGTVATSLPTYQAQSLLASAVNDDVEVTWPAHVTNDVSLLFVRRRRGLNTLLLSTPSGWTKAKEWTLSLSEADHFTFGVFWRRASSGSMSPVDILMPADAEGWETIEIDAMMQTYRGCRTTGSPVDGFPSFSETVAGTSHGDVAAYVTTLNSLYVVGFAHTGSEIATVSFSGWTHPGFAVTERFDSGPFAIADGPIATTYDLGGVEATSNTSTNSVGLGVGLLP